MHFFKINFAGSHFSFKTSPQMQSEESLKCQLSHGILFIGISLYLINLCSSYKGRFNFVHIFISTIIHKQAFTFLNATQNCTIFKLPNTFIQNLDKICEKLTFWSYGSQKTDVKNVAIFADL